jgi:predicted nucleotidyltransferase
MKITDREKLFETVVKEYKEVFGEKLVSIDAYGSAVTKDFHPKYSDINLAIILTDLQPETLILAQRVVKALKKRRVVTPLFLTKEYVSESLDTFPIEFLNIKSSHKTIYGEDFFASLEIQPKHLRLQAERELKGKLLILRLALLENIGKSRLLQDVVITSFTSFVPVLKAILTIKNEEVPERTYDIIQKADSILHIDLSPFYTALKIKNHQLKLKGKDFVNFLEIYIHVVDNLASFVDKL